MLIGSIKGHVYMNGNDCLPGDAYFKKVSGYVEQFDSLPQMCTAREAVAFSAQLRLERNVTKYVYLI